MKSLRILLQSKVFYWVLVGIVFLNVFFSLKTNNYKSFYQGFETIIDGYIDDLSIDGNHVRMVVKAREKLLVNYYSKREKELEEIRKKYQIGDYIRGEGSFKEPASNSVFNLFNYRHYLLSQKVYWLFNATKLKKIERQPKLLLLIKRKMNQRIDKIKKSAPYLKTYLFSKTSEINNEVLISYQGNGLNHLLSLSGTHISFLVTVIIFILNKYSKKPFFNYLGLFFFLLFYLFLTNYPPSLLRAVIMFVFLKLNKLLNLKIKTLNLLIITSSFLLLYNPFYIYHLGFKFSFIISFYLILFRDFFQSKSYLCSTLMVSLMAFLVSIPILINNFFEINLLIPIINLLFIFIFVFIIFPFSIIVFFLPFFDSLLYKIIVVTENLSLLINRINLFKLTFSSLPFVLVLGYYLIITMVLKSLRNNHYYNCIYIILVLIIFFYLPFFRKYPVITFLDVGQGDSALIELPRGKGNILIDTGGVVKFNNDKWQQKKKDYSIVLSKTIPYLKSRGVKKIDCLVLTHGDYDHLGEARLLINNFKIKKVIFNSGHHNNMEKEIIEVLDKKEIEYHFYSQNKLNISGYLFYFLNEKNEQDENEDSLIVYTKLNEVNILLTGDAGKESEKFLIDTYNLPKMDILKVGHHGSKYSTSKEFLEYLSPSYAIVSVGLNNFYNHPHEEVINLLKINNVSYYLTSFHGSVKFILKENLLVKTCY